MHRCLLWVVAAVLCLDLRQAPAQTAVPIEQRRWFETVTAHFTVYSCAAPQDVYALATHLEQFSDAYSLLSGTPAVISPPIVVVAFPDQDSMKPFLPLYQGQPANMSGFFRRGSEVNLIVLALPGTNSAFNRMEVIFHEYAHLLFRHNSRIWPLWLSEGMADIYSTFETSGYTVRMARPIQPYLDLLARQPMMPLRQLFAVKHDSPQYNESERQGIFYAQSWLLTHYLMAGGTVSYRARFEQFTRLLLEGQLPEQAFTNALQTTLPAMEIQLRRYLEGGRLQPIQWMLSMNLSGNKVMNSRTLTPVEIYFQLGSELMRIDRLDAAESYFNKAKAIAPVSPLSYEGLGLVAAERKNHADAVGLLKDALKRGSASYLARYVYAQESLELTAVSEGRYRRLPEEKAADIRDNLQKVVLQTPDFGPANQLLGFVEILQGDDLTKAENYLQRAVRLEPDNPAFLLSLAQAQLASNKTNAARATLKPLLLPQAEPKLRANAEEILKKMGSDQSRR